MRRVGLPSYTSVSQLRVECATVVQTIIISSSIDLHTHVGQLQADMRYTVDDVTRANVEFLTEET